MVESSDPSSARCFHLDAADSLALGWVCDSQTSVSKRTANRGAGGDERQGRATAALLEVEAEGVEFAEREWGAGEDFL